MLAVCKTFILNCNFQRFVEILYYGSIRHRAATPQQKVLYYGSIRHRATIPQQKVLY